MVSPPIQIVDRIDENQLVTLKGNKHPSANTTNDRGRVIPTLKMTDLVLVLSRSPGQQSAFDAYVASQFDLSSPNYHHWLEPKEVGEDFGPNQEDVDAILSWLEGHGFSIDEVSKNHMSIRFSGNAGQVEETFHTEIHNLEVNGGKHIGNMTDPKIPAALFPAIVGVKALHDFFPRPLHMLGGQVAFNRKMGKWQRVASVESTGAKIPAPAKAHKEQPETSGTDSNGNVIEDVAPYDFATIYNVSPLWNLGIDGRGQTIAIAGTSDIDYGDVASFRKAFGLPAVNSFTTVVANGTDPGECTSTSATGTCTLNDLIENSLNVEWSGAIAPGANIVLIVSGSRSTTTDAVYSSADYVVENKPASILNVSYGECELFNGTTGNVAYYNLWQTAASEGIAVFVATGDSGSASCDEEISSQTGPPWVAEYGLSVNAIASTPYNTSVGGTDFDWCTPTTSSCTAAPYWGTSNGLANQATAKGYVPEVPWNDSCASPTGIAIATYWASQLTKLGYSVGSSTNGQTACNFFILSSAQIYELTEGQTEALSYVDTIGGGGGRSGCIGNDGVNVSSCGIATTTGTGNGSIPLVNDGWPKPSWQTGVPGIPADGVRDIPDVSFFAGDGLNHSAYLICVSAIGGCTYTGDDDEDPLAAQEVGGTSVASSAMAGVMALIDQKAGTVQGSPNSNLYLMASKQTYSKCSAETIETSNSCYFNDIDEGTIAQPCDYGDFGYISPNCTVATVLYGVGVLTSGVAGIGGYNAVRGYDMATGLGSLNVTALANAWPTPSNIQSATVGVIPAQSTLNTNTPLSVTCKVTGTGATPAGTVTLWGGGYTSSMGTISQGIYTFIIPANSLIVGTDTITINYSGDDNYSSASGTSSVVVTTSARTTPTVTVTPSSPSVTPVQALSVTVGVSGEAGNSTPTGTVTLTSGSYSTAGTTLSSGSVTITVPAGSLTVGSNTLTAIYTPDTTSSPAYNSTSATATVVVTIPTFTLVATTPVTVAQGSSVTSTVDVAGVSEYTGTIALTCSLSNPPLGATIMPICTVNNSTITLNSNTTTATTTVALTTATPTTSLARLTYGKNARLDGALDGSVLAFLLCLGVPLWRRNCRWILSVVVVTAALCAVTGCSTIVLRASSSPSNTAVTPGSYTFIVTGTGNPSVSPTPTAIFTLIVN
jgi:hypothetical protein